MDIIGYKRAACPCPFLVHMADDTRHSGGFPGFLTGGKYHGVWLVCVFFAVLSTAVYIAALLCSHLSAFRVASNIRKELMRHITALPAGVTEKYGSGNLRRIVNTSSAATENYLAHRLPDKAGAIATPIGLLFLLLFFD